MSMCGVGVLVSLPSSTTVPTNASISGGRPASMSYSIEVLCLPPSSGMGAIETVMQTGGLPGDVPPEIRTRLLELRDELATSKARHAKDAAERAAQAAAELAERKAQANDAATGHPDYDDPAAALRRAEWAAVGIFNLPQK